MQISQSPAAQPLRILLVEDFAEIRALIATMLARLGYEVDVAGDGASGWEAFCSKRYDLLITDNDMPILSGLDFVRRVRAVPDMLPVIVISGFSQWDESDLDSLLKPGAFIGKPFAFPILRAKIEELMRWKQDDQSVDLPVDSTSLPLQPEHKFRFGGAARGHPGRDVPATERDDTATTA